MSHTSTIYDWALGLQTALKEVRVGFPEMLKQHLLSIGNHVMTYVSDHSLMLMYGAVTLSVSVLVAYLLYKWTSAHNAVEEALRKLDFTESRLRSTQYNNTMYVNWHDEAVKENEALVEELSVLKVKYEELSEMNAELLKNISSVSSELESTQEERDDFESERDELEESRDSWACNAEHYESERDDAYEKIETLQTMVDTYRDLVSEMEATADVTKDSVLKLVA